MTSNNSIHVLNYVYCVCYNGSHLLCHFNHKCLNFVNKNYNSMMSGSISIVLQSLSWVCLACFCPNVEFAIYISSICLSALIASSTGDTWSYLQVQSVSENIPQLLVFPGNNSSLLFKIIHVHAARCIELSKSLYYNILFGLTKIEAFLSLHKMSSLNNIQICTYS